MSNINFILIKKNIAVTTQIEEDISITANKTLIETLLGNLLSNAIRHNIKDGHIIIRCNQKEFIIENSAKEESLNTEKLFQRFQKQSSDINSIGLGLEIVKKITSLYEYSIRYQFINKSHRFIIQF